MSHASRVRFTAELALATWLVTACTDPTTSLRDAGARPDAHEAAAPYTPDLDAITCDPTLASLREHVFGVACGFDSCHGDNNAAWGLYLTVPDLETQLVSVKSATCKGWELVAPGDPGRSFLYRKISQDHPPCGERMPFGLGKLPDSVVACVRGYIESLATDADADRPRADASP